MSNRKRKGRRRAQQLPHGRHGLPRSFVERNQRERILGAVADVTGKGGYATLTVEDIVGRAGISRRTFYEHFRNKDEAFLAAYDAAAVLLGRQVMGAIDEEEGFAARAGAGLGAFLAFLASEPAFARMCVVEVLAAGPEAIKRRNDTMRAFADLIQQNASVLLGDRTPPFITAETVVGGIYEVVYTRVLRGQTRTLPELLPDLAYSALLPYLGPKEAEEERRRLVEELAAAG